MNFFLPLGRTYLDITTQLSTFVVISSPIHRCPIYYCAFIGILCFRGLKMFNACRRGPASICRALITTAPTIRIASTRPSILSLVNRTSTRLSTETRWLHISSALRNQSTAEYQESHEQPMAFGKEQQRIVTKFQELVDHGMVHHNVIDAITKDLGHHTMTEVQTMTINAGLLGTDM